jgi:hypothetical protein
MMRTYRPPLIGSCPAAFSTGSVLTRMATLVAVPTVTHMPAQLPVQRVEISFSGAAPITRIERASGVSDVERDGPIVRCTVTGAFQPFLEALRGHEVATLQSTPLAGASPRTNGDLR